MNHHKLPYILILILILTACRKEELSPDLKVEVLSPELNLRSLFILNDTNWFVVGGKTNVEGYIYQSINQGISWTRVYESNWNIYDISFFNDDLGLASGDRLRILKTEDRGTSWNDLPLSWFPAEAYFVPLKHIELVDDTAWYFTGGQYYDRGVNIRTRNGGLWTDVTVFQVELNTSFFKNPQHGILGGYGIIYETSDVAVTFEPVDFKGDNISGLAFTDADDGLASGYDGGIYKTHDGGLYWETVLKPNIPLTQRNHFNDIARHGDRACAVGMNGIIYLSFDGGNTWNPAASGTNEDLWDVDAGDEGQFIICGEKGVFITVWP
jgi:photosystem II stability/assembly factor-like uncharacterized protein